MGTSLLADALRRDRHLQVLTAFTSREIYDQIRNHAPDVLVISPDHEEQSEDSFSLVRQLWRDHPGLRIILLLDSPRRDLVVNALRAGASGIFCRVDPIQALRKCIYRVHAGQIWASNRDMEYVLQVLRETAHLHIVVTHGDPLSERAYRQELSCTHLP
jgi:DNA-binding NarL/FixJ family response regulator